MTVQDIRYTRADYDEATRAIRRHSSRAAGWGWAAALFAVIGVAQLLAPFVQTLGHGRGTGDGCGGLFSGAFYLLAAAMLYAFFVRSAPVHGVVPPVPGPSAARHATNAVLCLIVFAAFVGVPALVPPELPAPPPPKEASGGSALLLLLPWITLFAALWVLVSQMFRATGRLAWEWQPELNRPQTIHLSDGGVVVQDVVSERRFAWTAFIGWQETANLFLLLRSHAVVAIVPKRCLATPSAVDQFRGGLMTSIRPQPPITTPSNPMPAR